MRYLHSSKGLLLHVFINHNEKKVYVEKPGRHHLNQVIKVYITNNHTYQNCVLPDRIQREKHGVTAVIFLPKMHNLVLIIKK